MNDKNLFESTFRSKCRKEPKPSKDAKVELFKENLTSSFYRDNFKIKIPKDSTDPDAMKTPINDAYASSWLRKCCDEMMKFRYSVADAEQACSIIAKSGGTQHTAFTNRPRNHPYFKSSVLASIEEIISSLVMCLNSHREKGNIYELRDKALVFAKFLIHDPTLAWTQMADTETLIDSLFQFNVYQIPDYDGSADIFCAYIINTLFTPVDKHQQQRETNKSNFASRYSNVNNMGMYLTCHVFADYMSFHDMVQLFDEIVKKNHSELVKLAMKQRITLALAANPPDQHAAAAGIRSYSCMEIMWRKTQRMHQPIVLKMENQWLRYLPRELVSLVMDYFYRVPSRLDLLYF